MRRLFLTSIFCVLCASPALAQNLLPQAFGAWTASPSTQTPIRSDASLFGPGILDEYGVLSIEQKSYARGLDQLDVTLFRMADPTAAYGAFTYLHTPEMRPLAISKYSVGLNDRAIVTIGNFLLYVKGERAAATESDLQVLAGALKPQADSRPYPVISEHLPEAGLIPGSERYILGAWGLATFAPIANGDWVGFGQGAEAILANYRNGTKEASLLVIEYPTQQIAGAHAAKIGALAASALADSGKRTHKSITVKRSANLVTLAMSSDEISTPYAQSLLGQVHFGHDVMWNEPSFKAKEPKLNVMVVGAFLGTGVILVLAIVTGFGFGLMRIAMKIFFPGKVFDRHRSIEIIQLGISGRPVNTKDLY